MKNVKELSYGLYEKEAYFSVETNAIGRDIMDLSVKHCYEYQGASLRVMFKIDKNPAKGITAHVSEYTIQAII